MLVTLLDLADLILIHFVQKLRQGQLLKLIQGQKISASETYEAHLVFFQNGSYFTYIT